MKPADTQDSLTGELLKRLPKREQPDAAPQSRRQPPETHQFGYKGGKLLGKLLDC